MSQHWILDSGQVWSERTQDFLRPRGKLGYQYVRIGGRECLVHRLVAAAFLGVPTVGQEVNHKNGIRDDNRASNLEYVTRRENMRDAARRGTLGKLSASEARAIRSSSESNTALARRHGVSQGLISLIKSGRRWQCLT